MSTKEEEDMRTEYVYIVWYEYRYEQEQEVDYFLKLFLLYILITFFQKACQKQTRIEIDWDPLGHNSKKKKITSGMFLLS